MLACILSAAVMLGCCPRAGLLTCTENLLTSKWSSEPPEPPGCHAGVLCSLSGAAVCVVLPAARPHGIGRGLRSHAVPVRWAPVKGAEPLVSFASWPHRVDSHAQVKAAALQLCQMPHMLPSRAVRRACSQSCMGSGAALPCRLSPLATCLPTVAQEFLAQAAALRLLDPVRFASVSPSVRVRVQRPLEMFFPFDPYLLCTSAGRLALDSSYLRWQQSAPQQAAAGECTVLRVWACPVLGSLQAARRQHSATWAPCHLQHACTAWPRSCRSASRAAW